MFNCVLGVYMTSRLIGLGLSNHLSCSVRAKVEYYRSLDHFCCQITDCQATSNITGRYPQPTGSLIRERVFYPSTETQYQPTKLSDSFSMWTKMHIQHSDVWKKNSFVAKTCSIQLCYSVPYIYCSFCANELEILLSYECSMQAKLHSQWLLNKNFGIFGVGRG